MKYPLLFLLAPLALAQPPAIHGPKVYGVRPGNPVLYRVPATGERPMRFTASGLPPGLELDAAKGLITGKVEKVGAWQVTLRASNAKGRDQRIWKLVAGDRIALTPPMGWSTWYMAYENISDKLVRAQVDAMVSTGLADHGYAYVNLDDGWNIKPDSKDPLRTGPVRDASGNLRLNGHFPEMKALVDYVHASGLKAGIYISPGPRTCAGYEGSWRHEEQDLKQFVAWGFDFLKYDWCSYGRISPDKTLENYQRPYRLMGGLLAKAPRDIVFNLCQYGLGDVWKWGREVGGNYWRTTGDISLGNTKTGDFWSSVEKIGFGQAGKEPFAGPGGWNDPDNLLIGHVLVGQTFAPTPLSPDEQRSYFSLWAMLSAPLVLGSDMTKLDAATLQILTNDEVIDINQDPLGHQAAPAEKQGAIEIWTKDLEGGAKAYGLFNRGSSAAKATVKFDKRRSARDLWAHRDLGRLESWSDEVSPHGVVLLTAR